MQVVRREIPKPIRFRVGKVQPYNVAARWRSGEMTLCMMAEVRPFAVHIIASTAEFQRLT